VSTIPVGPSSTGAGGARAMLAGMSGAALPMVHENLTIRMMRDAADEYERFAAWRNLAHVRDWWDPDDPPMTTESAFEEYGADVAGRTATRAAIIEVDGTPVGFLQFYPWAAYQQELVAIGVEVPAGAWGLDIFIGEPQWLSRGIGSRAVRTLCDRLIRDEGATAIAFGVEKGNQRARRAYEKAGLTPTVEFLDSDTRGGERVLSILMVRFA
jgi:RimJ/RimL family protein N-acetyltransferase